MYKKYSDKVVSPSLEKRLLQRKNFNSRFSVDEIKPKKLFVGCDVAVVNCGLAIIDENEEVVYLNTSTHDFPEELRGVYVNDTLRNDFQISWFKREIAPFQNNIEFLIQEGPNYGPSNTTPISIGAIHGVYWQYYLDNNISFAVATPKSIYSFTHGNSKEMKKSKTISAMKSKFPNVKIYDSNEADALAMAIMAKRLYETYTIGKPANKSEREILCSRSLYNGHPKGLGYQLDNKVFISFKKRSNFPLLDEYVVKTNLVFLEA